MSISKRSKIANEIIESERVYVTLIGSICDAVITPALKKGALDETEVLMIFSNLEQIRRTNQELLLSLESEGEDSIGRIFHAYSGLFKMYKEYISNHENATKILDRVRNRDQLREILKELEDDPRTSNQDIHSLLITPIQRIPRYKLLLENLLKETEDSLQHEEISKALDSISHVAWSINDHLDRTKCFFEVLELQKQFSEDLQLANHNRKLVRTGLLMKKCRSADKEFTFMLFNDLLLYAHGGIVSQYVLHRKIEINEEFKCNDLADTKDEKFRFEILNHHKSFIVYAKTLQDKEAWMHVLHKCIAEACLKSEKSRPVLRKLKPMAPILASNASSKTCNLCEMQFNLIRRRQHCQKCGQLVCSDCSKSRMRLGKGDQAKRVCDQCVKLRNKNVNSPSSWVTMSPVHGVPSPSSKQSETYSFDSFSPKLTRKTSDDHNSVRDSMESLSMAVMPTESAALSPEDSEDDQDQILHAAQHESGFETSSRKMSRTLQRVDSWIKNDRVSYSSRKEVNPVSLPRDSNSSRVSVKREIVQEDEFEKLNKQLEAKTFSIGVRRERRGISLDMLNQAEYYPGDEFISLCMRRDSQQNGELEMEIGDKIRIQPKDRRNSSEWLFGQNGRTLRLGWVYPSDVVRKNDFSQRQLSQMLDEAKNFFYVAGTDFDGNEQTFELSIGKGDRVTIEEKHKSGFWYGYNHTSQKNGWIDPSMLLPLK